MLYIDTLKIIKDSLSSEEHLKRIQEFTQTTAVNTTFCFWRKVDFWEYIAISLSVLAILLAIITAILQWKTERNTRMQNAGVPKGDYSYIFATQIHAFGILH